MRWLKYLFITLLIVLGIAAAGISYLSSQYGEIVQSLVITALNDNLKSEVKVSSVTTGSLEDLPYFSLVFTDVAIMEDPDYREIPDTLIYVERLSLQFNVWDIYFEDYQLKKVGIENGFGRFEVDKKGRKNYFFWKSDTATNDTTQFSFNLNAVSLNNISYSYIDKGIKLGVKTHADQASMTGNFTSENLEIKTNGEFEKTYVSVGGIQVVNYRDLEINTGLQIDPSSGRITFMPGEIRVDYAFTLKPSGYIKGSYYKFECSSKAISVTQLNSLVPKRYSGYQEFYETSGKANFTGMIAGDANSNLAPEIQATLQVEDGTIRKYSNDMSVKQVKFVCDFSNGKNRNAETSSLNFTGLEALFPSGSLSGSIVLNNFKSLYTKSDLKGQLRLSDLQQFAGLDSIGTLDGTLQIEMQSTLYLTRLLSEEVNLKGSRLKGLIKLDGISYVDPNASFKLANTNGLIELKNKSALVKGIEGQIQSSKFQLDGQTNNFLYWLFSDNDQNNEMLNIEADIQLDKMNLEEFLFADAQSNESEGKVSSALKYRIKLDTKIGEFTMADFKATQVKSTTYLAPGRIALDPLEFKSMNGTVLGKGMMAKIAQGYDVQIYGALSKVEIDQLFESFNDFGQNELTGDNLHGRTEVNISLSGKLNEDLKFDMKTIKANANVEISDGELIDYTTLQVVSDYFKKNVVLKRLFKADELAESLKHVKFDKLQNQLLVQDQTVILPQMYIGTSVLGINIEGTYNFNDSINYRLDFDVNELLLAQKGSRESDEYAMEDDGNGVRVFLHMYGPIDNPIVEIDKERRRLHKQGKRNEEKQEFKTALKEEFGIFKKDTSLTTPNKKIDFQIEWEEAIKEDTLKSEKDDTSKGRKKVLKNLLKPKNNLNDDEEFDFGDDDF